ncbi:MAG: DUF2283 domain-containing protein [Ardenticatenaceae bacterium]|nr:DUF2283 domain-containing protein [Ardenticatenaceae bacterium]
MSELSLHEIELVTEDGQKIRLGYEEVGDILEIVFDDVEATCALELTDNIVLRFDRQQGQAAGLTILDFSVLASPTELGVRSFALTGLDTLPEELREMVIRIITTPPVNQFLKVTTFYISPTEQVPLTYVESPRELASVA